MKVIFSRKGFDSENGKVPSPILPDGRLLSLPIPDNGSEIPYAEIAFKLKPYTSVAQIVADLADKGKSRPIRAHLDPDLRREAFPRERGWRPLFGQAGAAQSHLANQRVGAGDLFLFFGWFRHTEWHQERLRFVPGAPNLHVLFGWMLIESVIDLESGEDEPPRWSSYHPHCCRNGYGAGALYIANKQFGSSEIAGAGHFPRFHQDLCLTAPGQPRGTWWLPECFFPAGDRDRLTYHTGPSCWTRCPPYTQLQTVSRGQEFVLDASQYPGVTRWAKQIIREHGSKVR